MIGILHGADLHLDSPFAAFSPAEGAKYRAMQRQLPAKLVQLANERDCRLLLLSGDIFDSEEVHPETVQALHDALMGFRGHVCIAPGNHDPYTDLSVWAQCAWSENVHIFTKAYECIVLEELGCRVHGGAFFGQDCYVPLPKIDRCGYTEVGVFHADCLNSGSYYRPTDRDTIAESGFDYLAFGHIHKRKMPEKLADTWYGWPGVTMGRGFDEPGPCGVFVIQLQGGDCEAEFVPVQAPTYEIITVPPGMSPTIPQNSQNCHCRLRFVGRQCVDADEIYRTYEDKFLSLQIEDETEPLYDLWEACGDGTLRGLALDVLREGEDPDLAALAAQYLLCALEGREAP